MKKIGLVLIFILSASLFGCAITKVTDTFRFESRGLEIKVGEEKELGIIKGDADEDSVIIYLIESETYGDDNVLIPANEIAELRGSSTTFVENDTTQGADDHMKLYGKKVGTVRITAYLEETPNITDTILITIVAEKLSGFQLIAEKTLITVGEKMALSTKTLPENIQSDAIYSSSDENIAKVDQSGFVEGTGVGTVIISATSVYDSTVIAKKTIEVVAAPVLSVEVTEATVTLNKGDTYQIVASAVPSYAPQTLIYTSSNTNCATVNASGLVTTKDVGTTKITIKSATGNISTEVEVTVKYVAETSLTVASNSISVECGKTTGILFNVGPFNAEQKLNVVFISGNENVSVDQVLIVPNDATDTRQSTLNIKGLIVGSAQIKVETANKSYSETIDITITPAVPASIDIEDFNSNIIVGGNVQLVGSILPAEALQSLIFESEDETIATVDANGLITAVKAGTTNITVYDQAKTINKVCVINVYDVATEIVTTPIASNVIKNEIFTFTVSVNPSTALQEGFTVEISDENIVAVANKGNNVYEIDPFDAGTFEIIIKYAGLELRKTVTIVTE